MWTSSPVVFLLPLLLVAVRAGAECPTGFFSALDGCFLVGEQEGGGPTNLGWQAARDRCTALFRGGWTIDLATFDSVAQLESVSQSWAVIGGSFDYEYPYMWVGIHKVGDQFLGVDGKSVSSSSYIWQVAHPRLENQFVYLDDVTLSTGQNSFGRLYAVSSPSTVVRRYMCRATSSPAPASNS
ncbi:uncharacterized protein [Panulirus ornatus]|uniref:uncharacterized protein n=1 Tax=Panulirus ornatus TaxID=150431 RepID=UPI003A8BAD82